MVCSFAASTAWADKLPLTLVGTIVRTDASQSLGTLRFTHSGSTEVYRVQSKVSTLATVIEYKRETAILLNQATGQREVLRIPPFEHSRRATSQAIDDKATTRKELQLQRTEVDRALSNLGALLQEARAEPVLGPDGRIQAFRLAWFRAGSVWEKLGLKEGDSIHSVNGQRVTSVQAAVEIFNQLKSSSMIDLKVGRGSREVDITYLIR